MIKKYITIECSKCNIKISKDTIPSESLIKIGENTFKILPFYLKCYLPSGKIKLNELKNYLYENIKCVSCDKKLGRFIKTATDATWHIIDHIVFNSKFLNI